MTDIIWEKAREIPVRADVDVLVLGSGPSGFSAAVCAAREGAKTMLLERGGDVGGLASTGCMSHWIGNTKGGFYEELLDRSSDAAYDPSAQEKYGKIARQIINPEKLKTVLLEMLEEAGVQLRLYTLACEPIMEGDSIRGVFAEGKSGREAIRAKVVIDATGDGDIAARAGVPFTLGREGDGKMQPASILFRVAGVDYERAIFPGAFEEDTPVPGGGIQTLGHRFLIPPMGHVLLVKTTLPGVVTCNMTNCLDVDGTNTEQLTAATVVCRKQIHEAVDFLRAHAPGYENCFLISSGSGIGIRESRHFCGRETLRAQDILEAREFPNWVVRNVHFEFDIHNMSGAGLDETGVTERFPQAKGYTIPYGCLLPQKVKNLLLTGRAISGEHLAHASYRVMPICAKLGQAAGLAAAQSVKDHVKPSELDVAKLQKILISLE